ncbi:MAG: F0F1 ATP synthase subunit A [Lachnospiraceae bacterium]|nr:F0F1 ATP synthase subunit A [Candidatus Fimimorpha excrementavium]
MRWLAADNDFMIKGLVSYELFGQTFWITTSHAALLLVVILLIGLAWIANRYMKKAGEVPDTFQNIIEIIVEKLDQMVGQSMGAFAGRFQNYIGTIFLFLLLCNISGIFGLRSPTADYGITLLLGLVTFALIHINGVRRHKRNHVASWFQPIPLLFPINVIGDLAVPLSLSLRLFGNVMSGTVMIGLWYGMLPWFMKLGIPAFLHAYFDLFSGAIQTYVFCMLSMVYIRDKME